MPAHDESRDGIGAQRLRFYGAVVEGLSEDDPASAGRMMADIDMARSRMSGVAPST